MRSATHVVVAAVLIASSASILAQAPRSTAMAFDEKNIIAFSNRAEGATLSDLAGTRPLIEAVFQSHVPIGALRFAVSGDRYELGRFSFSSGPAVESLVSREGLSAEADEGRVVRHDLRNVLAEIMAPDWQLLTPDRYKYTPVTVTFLGAVRCHVFDVEPLDRNQGGFTGRVYLEDRMWHVVRFTGVNSHVDAKLAAYFGREARYRIDSWRHNVKKNRWLPSYAYIEEVAPLGTTGRPLLRGQVRFWSYEKPTLFDQQRFTDITLDQSREAPVRRVTNWPSPPRSRRLFDAEAERNLLARLRRGGFVGPIGPVEEMIEQVIRNLVVSSKLVLAAPVRARVTLLSPFETFTIGDTILISRGLIDVTPSEPVLALLLAHQLAHNALGHRKVDSRFSFSDVLDVSDRELLERLRFRYSPSEEAAADIKALDILEHSPYKDQLSDAGLFIQALHAQAPYLRTLIEPHFGEHVADVKGSVQNDEKTRFSPVFDVELPSQLPALALGSRLVVDPWDGHVSIVRPEALLAPTADERVEFRVTPFMPFLDYVVEKPLDQASAVGSKTTVGARGARQTQSGTPKASNTPRARSAKSQ